MYPVIVGPSGVIELGLRCVRRETRAGQLSATGVVGQSGVSLSQVAEVFNMKQETIPVAIFKVRVEIRPAIGAV